MQSARQGGEYLGELSDIDSENRVVRSLGILIDFI